MTAQECFLSQMSGTDDLDDQTTVVLVPGYRYSLKQVPDPHGNFMTLPRSVVISALHKFDRHGHDRETLALESFFFSGVAKLTGLEVASVRGGITNLLNREAIILFEECSFLHLHPTDQRSVVCHLLKARGYAERQDPDWRKCLRYLSKKLCLTQGLHRCRAGSVTKAFEYARSCGIDSVDPAVLQKVNGTLSATEHDVLRHVNNTMTDRVADAKKSSPDFSMAYVAARQYLPEAAKLIDPNGGPACARFADCAELRKNIYCAAHCARLMTCTPAVRPYLAIMPALFDTDLLQRIGVFDQHVKGIGNATARSVFQERGCRVGNPSPFFSLCGLTYDEMEHVYVEASKVLHVAKAEKKKNGAASKRKADKQQGKLRVKKTKKTTDGHDRTPPAGVPVVADLTRLLTPDVASGDRLLGFKNLTLTAELTTEGKALFPQMQDQKAFLKIGEETARNKFTCDASLAMQTLGMPFVISTMVGVPVGLALWKEFGDCCHAADPTGSEINGRSYKAWTDKLTKQWASIENTVACALLQSKFDGTRLTYIQKNDPRLSSPVFGKSMLETLLLSKWCGSIDLCTYNLMVDTGGRVLQIDLGPSSDLQVARFNGKKLITSHKIGGDFLNAAKLYHRENRAEVAAFIDRLSGCGMPKRDGVVMPSVDELF